MLVLAVLVWSSIYEIAICSGSRELWTFIGENIHLRCKIPTSTSHRCNTTKPSTILNVNLADNSEENRRYIFRHVRVRCNRDSVHIVIQNVTQRSTGMYWCEGYSDLFTDVNIIDRIRKPKNISCVFHNKRILRCNYSVQDRFGFNQYACVTHAIRLGNKCPADEYDNMQWNNTTGSCTYTCGSCTDNVSVFIRAWNIRHNKTFCRIAVLRHLIKPGPVRNLRLIQRNTTSITLEWNKPDDEDNEWDTYIYTAYWPSHTYSLTSKDNVLTAVIQNLKPGQKSMFIVRAKPKKKGYLSEPVSVTVTTLEDMPACGPLVPAGSFSVSRQGLLAVYWQHVPEKDRGGRLVGYMVEMNSFTIRTEAESVCVLVELPQSSPDNISIKLRAGTRIGYSPPTILNIPMKDMDAMLVSSVSRDGNTTRWSTTGISSHTARVHRCYGSFYSNTQLVNCKTEIEYHDVGEVTELEWSSPPVPTLQCAQCDWHYSVSLHHNNVTGGMVWARETDEITRSALVAEDVEYWTTFIIGMCIVTTLLFLILILIACRYKKTFCSEIPIIVPKYTNVHLQEDHFKQTLLTSPCRNILSNKEKPPEEVQCTTEETVITEIDPSCSDQSSDCSPQLSLQEETGHVSDDPSNDNSGLSLYRFQPDGMAEVISDDRAKPSGTLGNNGNETMLRRVSSSALSSVAIGECRDIQDLPPSGLVSKLERDEASDGVAPKPFVTKCNEMTTLESSSHDSSHSQSEQSVTDTDKKSSESEVLSDPVQHSSQDTPCSDKCRHSTTHPDTSEPLLVTHSPKITRTSSKGDSDFVNLKSKLSDERFKDKPHKLLAKDPLPSDSCVDTSASSYSYISLSSIEAQNLNKTSKQDSYPVVSEIM